MRRKTRSRKGSNRQVEFLEEALSNNVMAIQEGGKRKRFSSHDLKNIKALTTPQELMIRSYLDGNNIIANGSAGTGKTFIGIYLALSDILSKESKKDKIIIVRSIVPGREVGFLKGDLAQKLAPYEAPYQDIFGFLLGKHSAYETMKETHTVTFAPTSFLRGVTWDDAVIIMDEIQNFNWEELNTVITRVGQNSSIIAIGDYIQNDLYRTKYDTSGFKKFINIASKIDLFDEIRFTRDDVVRSELVKKWICAVEDYRE